MDTGGKWRIDISTFGGFSMSARAGEKRVLIADDANSRRQKMWTLLEYLAVFRDRCVTAEELIDVLYQDEGTGDPLNSLRILVYRTRAKLESAIPGTGAGLIISVGSGYGMDRRADISMDAEKFEDIFRETRREQMTDAVRLGRLMQAAALYRGRFLPRSSVERWVIPLDTYFHSEYLAVCAECCAILEEQKRWGEIISLCKEAVLRDPYAENIHIALMTALARSGARDAAEQHYKNLTDMYFRDFGIPPSEVLSEFHSRMRNAAGEAQRLDDVKLGLDEPAENRGALECALEAFRQIYRLKAREYWRTGEPTEFVLLTLPAGKKKNIDVVMVSLGEVIRTTLRSGDIFARYSRTQYALLLQSVNAEAAGCVMERFRKNCLRKLPGYGARLRYGRYPLNWRDAGGEIK